MTEKRNSKVTLPNLSLAEAHHKADKFSLSDLHRQTNSAAKQAILYELHSSMQLRAERIRLHRKGSSDTHHDDSDDNVKDADERKPVTQVPSQCQTKHVTFGEAHLEPRLQSRIPVPVRQDPNQRSRSHKVSNVKGQDARSRITQSVRRRGDGDQKHHGNQTVNFEYTWGQRGRLNELRIREHYNSRLMRKMFDEWREFWWIQRREWTLMIRAEYHHRYKMYQHVWICWRAFVVREKVKNAKKEISTIHASSTLLLKAMLAWKHYVTLRRAKRVLKQKAEKVHQRHALQFCWNEWRAAMQQRREENDAEVFALQYWAESLVQRVSMECLRWRRRWLQKQEMKEKERQAQHHYEKTLVSRCYYQGFIPYTHHRKEKRRINAQAYQVYSDRLLTHSWQHWNQRWFTRRSLAQRQEQVDRLGNRARMRRLLTHWRFYIHQVHIERRKEDIARIHHNTQLKKLGLLMLRLAVVQRRVKERRKEQAIELHQEMLVKRCWNQWILQCEHREELRLFSATRKARQMHRKHLLTAVFQQWCHYTVWRRHRKAQYARADAHYARSNLLPKCIHSLRDNAELEKKKRALHAQAMEFYREGELGRCFYRWCQSFQLSQDVRMMERMAFLHHESILARRFFTEWRERTRSKLQESEKMFHALDHHHVSLSAKALKRWMEFTVESRQRSEFERKASEHAYIQTTRKAWDIWRKYVSYRRLKEVKKERADLHYNRKQIRRVFIAWKFHCQKMHVVYQVVATKETAVNRRRLRHAFSDWKVCVETAKEERLLERIAIHHWNTRMLNKIVATWHAYAQQHAADTALKVWRLHELQAQLDRGILRRAFLAWKQCAKTEAEDRRRETKADTFHAEKLRQRCFQQWKAYRLLAIKKTLMARQALWLNRIRMQAKFFKQWKQQYSEAKEENGKTVMALWLWSMRLQQHTLHAWIRYVKERRRKKARITQALEQRRVELLREGVRQWLMVAGSLGERRAAVAAQHHAQTSLKSYQVVQRCAALWRQKTIANRGKKKKHRSMKQRKVRFEDEHPTRGHRSKVTLPPTTLMSSMTVEPLGSRGLPVISASVEERVMDRAVGETSFSTKPVMGKVRPQPRKPDFLRDSLQREGLWSRSDLHAISNNSEEEHHHSIPPKRSKAPPISRTFHDLSNLNEPVGTRKPIPNSVPPEDMGKTRSCGLEGQADEPRTTDSEFVHSERDDSDNKKKIIDTKFDSRSARAFTLPKTTDGPRHTQSGDVSGIEMKPPVLLPPSAFSSGQPSTSYRPSKGASQSTSDGVGMLPRRTSSIPFNIEQTPRFGDEVKDKSRADSTEVLYAEIQGLKNILQGYQDMKHKLKRLKSQEAELQGWVKELNLPSSTEDSAALLIGDELTQVQEEIALLTSQLHQKKPHIKNILSQITQLTQQATG
ncbi:protein SFI1 homolog [Lytechinus variegatus]|uniref:protein SFI1 homolog n=1 Tax=Lytechinus variegatus TaxID=7654 RepID=UPI001BB1202A|nr:protein SFI1 homolog [Lytechinus variegatus]